MTDPPLVDIIVKEWYPLDEPPIIHWADEYDMKLHRCNPEEWISEVLAPTGRSYPHTGIIVVVDQSVDFIDIQPLLDSVWNQPQFIASAYVRTPGIEPQEWYEPVSPFAWAVSYRTLLALIEGTENPWPQSFGLELLLGHWATEKPGYEPVHIGQSVANLSESTEVDDAKGNLYYREIADIKHVHEVIGWASPT